MPRQRPISTVVPPAIFTWRWLSVLHAKLIDQLEADAAAAGVVAFSWFEVLTALELSPSNRVRCKELVDAVLLTRAGVSRLLDRIEAAGLLRREACAGDGRGADAVLTPTGAAALRRARPVYARTIDRCFGRHLAGAQIDQLTALFRQILAANDWLPDVQPVAVTISRAARVTKPSGPSAKRRGKHPAGSKR